MMVLEIIALAFVKALMHCLDLMHLDVPRKHVANARYVKNFPYFHNAYQILVEALHAGVQIRKIVETADRMGAGISQIMD
jgi:hypothetical protein